MARQGKTTVIVIAAIQSLGSSNGSVTTSKSQRCKNQREDPDENNDGLYAIATRDSTVANVGDCNVAIKTSCAQIQGCCDNILLGQDFYNC